ncbi:hypothetical protein UPYG_G00006960 [Umbra pygmaea]|uniref:Calponin-homology (CH) domain-containing protein n=1 Tax=Umbra pygmaea TaxID=75934 RepID=A0ABD0XHN7_UMBPY
MAGLPRRKAQQGSRTMAKNVESPQSPDPTEEKCNRYDLLDWLNKRLEIQFTRVEQICSGSCYCQLMDCLFPGCIDLSTVKFQTQEQTDFLHNYSLLQAAFKKNGVTKVVPVDELIKGKFQSNFVFLKWFKRFFQMNFAEQVYNPVEARKGQGIEPAKPPLGFSPRPASQGRKSASRSLNQSGGLETDTDEEGVGSGVRKHIIYLSTWEETYPWAKPSTLGDKYAYCSLCDINLNIHHSGLLDLKRHSQTKNHRKQSQAASNGSVTPTSVKRKGAHPAL